jgi:hypothetical protein
MNFRFPLTESNYSTQLDQTPDGGLKRIRLYYGDATDEMLRNGRFQIIKYAIHEALLPHSFSSSFFLCFLKVTVFAKEKL